MRKYIQAKIKVVELNSEQAVLEVCKIGGAYMNTQFGSACTNINVTGGWCQVTAKGRGDTTGTGELFNAAPS